MGHVFDFGACELAIEAKSALPKLLKTIEIMQTNQEALITFKQLPDLDDTFKSLIKAFERQRDLVEALWKE